MLERLAADSTSLETSGHYRVMIPQFVRKYRWFVPVLFNDGPLHIFAPLKALFVSIVALFRPMMRGPFGKSEQAICAIKATALACENFMLALKAAGYDSCPLEGFDEPKVKQLLKLPAETRIVMVTAAGRRADGGVIPQVRYERPFYVHRV
jgi:nitroreductase